jgi:hypothetical protein
MRLAGQLLDVLGAASEAERAGALKLFSQFVRVVGSEMRIAANVMQAEDWHGLDRQLDLMEGYVRLQHMEAARRELSGTLSRITTLSERLMSSLREAGLL